MSTTPSERRLIKNELVFRNANMKVRKALERLKKSAQLEGFTPLETTEIPLHFYCECSDKDCRERIIMSPEHYAKVHKAKRRFIILPGHETSGIEKVVKRTRNYFVVEKSEILNEAL